MSASNETRSADKALPKIALHAWHGLTLGTFWRLFSENRFSVSPKWIHRVVVIFVTSTLTSVLNRVSRPIYRARVESTRIEKPPVFIIGHWRTGTTLLHELMMCDDRLGCPDTYRCMVPEHFLLSEAVLPKLVGFLLPKNRPMDNMPISWERPQEDEFALSNQGLPTPYWFWMYPDRPCPYDNYLDLSGLTDAELTRWKDGFTTFLKRITLRDPRRIVLKSPTHTARIATLLELYPDAKFIHLVRDPQVMIPSTVRTWRRMGEFMGIRSEIRADIFEYVLDTFRRLYAAYDAQHALIPDDQFIELRYEELTDDMIGSVRRIYDHLGLEGFDEALPALEAHVGEISGYRTNRFDPDPATRARIAEACADYARRYGYSD